MQNIPRIYIGAVVAAAVILILLVPWSDVGDLAPRDLIGAVSFCALAILAQIVAIDLERGARGKVDSSVAFLPLLTSVVLFPPAVAVASVGTAELVTQIIKRRSGWVVAFNVAQGVLAVGLGAMVYNAISSASVDTAPDLMGFAATVAVLSFTNVSLITGALTFMERQSLLETGRRAMGPGGANILYYFLASPIALIAAVLYNHLYIWGVIIFLLPLLLVRYSYLSKLQLQAANTDLLRVLVKAIETRDPYTSGHSMRVAEMARSVGKGLGLSHRLLEQVEVAALLHDIGKIDACYAEMIGKPAELSEEERVVIRSHATVGADLLQTLSLLNKEVIDGVRHHHERFDGHGYPDGMKGDQIPIAARIIMLCDSIDAMLSDRSYRQALSVTEIKKEILRCAGTQFDPKLVRYVIDNGMLKELAGDGRANRKAPPDLYAVG